MEMTNTSLNTHYDIPMTETQYELLKESFKDFSFIDRYTIDYDEDFQQAHICCNDGAWLEQTHDEYIFTSGFSMKFVIRYIINKRTGKVDELLIRKINSSDWSDMETLANGLKRVYGTYNKDFISDKLKHRMNGDDYLDHIVILGSFWE